MDIILDNPFIPLTKAQILEELDESEKQVAEGRSREAVFAIEELRKKHGFDLQEGC